jgi:hypothetical protein
VIDMMRHHLLSGLAAATALLLVGPSWAAGDLDPAAMAKALREASVPLGQAIKASERQGKPISAKYEIEHDALQLSVYTMNRDQFSEVIVDHKKGTIDKSTAIVSGDDLKDAGDQGSAMSRAKVSLEEAVHKAEGANAGYRAISAIPSMEDGRPVATVLLMKGEDLKKVVEKLD